MDNEKYSLDEGLNSLKRIRLMMNYQLDKTLDENLSRVPILLENAKWYDCIQKVSKISIGPTNVTIDVGSQYFIFNQDKSYSLRRKSDNKTLALGGWRCKPLRGYEIFTIDGDYYDSETRKWSGELKYNYPSDLPKITAPPKPQKPTKYKYQGMDNTGTHYFIKVSYKSTNPLLGKNNYYEKDIKEGKYTYTTTEELVNDALQEYNKMYEKDLTEWSFLYDRRLYRQITRKSPKGKDVPRGYSPEEYDEYLEEKAKLEKKLRSVTTYISTPTGQMIDFDNPNYKKVKGEILALDLKYNAGPNFPQGLTQLEKKNKEDLEKATKLAYQKRYAECVKKNPCKFVPRTFKYNPNVSDETTYVMNTPTGRITLGTGTYDAQLAAFNADEKKRKLEECPCEKILLELPGQLQNINQKFGYENYKPDTRSDFDLWWDNWGHWIPLGLSLLVTVALPPLGAGLTTVLMADGAINLTTAAYELSRGQYENAAISTLFAFLPRISREVFKVPANVAASLEKKLMQKTFTTKDDLVKFVKGLSKEERRFFDIFIKDNPSVFKDATRKVVQNFENSLTRQGIPDVAGMTRKFEKGLGNATIKDVEKAMLKGRKIAWYASHPLKSGITGKRIFFEMGAFIIFKKFLKTVENAWGRKATPGEIKTLQAYQEAVVETLPQDVREIFEGLQTDELLRTVTTKDKEKIRTAVIEKAVNSAIQYKTNPKTNEKYTEQEIVEMANQIIEKYFENLEKLKNETSVTLSSTTADTQVTKTTTVTPEPVKTVTPEEPKPLGPNDKLPKITWPVLPKTDKKYKIISPKYPNGVYVNYETFKKYLEKYRTYFFDGTDKYRYNYEGYDDNLHEILRLYFNAETKDVEDGVESK